MISIIISIIACIFCTVAGVILYRYNQFSNDYYDVIDEVTDLLKAFSNYNEVLMAYSLKKVKVHTQIKLRLDSNKIIKNDDGEQVVQGLCATTVGRVVFNETLPPELPFYNYSLDHQSIKNVIQDCYKILGKGATIDLLDKIKEIGFKECTKAGLSLNNGFKNA